MADEQQIELEIPHGLSVFIGMPVGGSSIPLQTTVSLMGTADACARVGIECGFYTHAAAHVISRDAVFNAFLHSGADKLFWIDSDMVWSPDDFLRMVALSCRVQIVVAAYPAKVAGEAPTYYANFIEGPQALSELGLLKVTGMGLGFAIMSRQACERIAATKPNVHDQISGEDMPAVFRFDVHNGNRRTEDMAFFADLIDLGYTIYADPHITLGHVGPKEWRGRWLDTLRKAG